MFRRLLRSANLVTTVILLGLLFIMVNFIASRRYARWDFTKHKITAVSDRTLQLLRSLKDPVSVVVFYQPNQRLYDLIHDQLNEYERVSPKVTVEYVDPQRDVARAQQLVQEFQINAGDPNDPTALNRIIFKSGTAHKYLSDTDLAEYDYSTMGMTDQPRVKAFKGEDAFSSAILSVTQAEAPLVWMTQGHGEKSLDADDPVGLSHVKKYLEQQHLSVQPATLLEHPTIDANVKLIVIAGPTRRFTEQELLTLASYLERGGRVLALIDPLAQTGLDGLLAKWGVDLGMDIVVDPARQLPFVSAANLFVTTYTKHPIVQKMQTLMTLFPLTRSVRPVEPVPAGLTITPLALTSPEGWGETTTSVKRFQYDEGTDVRGPVSIAVAVDRAAPSHTRLVVIGDSDFVGNEQLPSAGNRDFVLGATYWLIEQEQLIGIGAKPLETIRLNLTGAQLSRFFWASFLAMPLLCGAAGAALWWLRRR